MAVPLIALKHVGIKIHGQHVLNDVSLNIFKGGHWAVTGISGSGKSSLLNAIAGKQALSSGIIDYHFTQEPGEQQLASTAFKRIAFIGQRHQFKNFANTTDFYYQQRYNSADAGDALTVAAYLQQIAGNAEVKHYWTLEKLIDRLQLGTLHDKQLIKLSNGETKRLRIAAALAKCPAVLLLDQPLTGLDHASRAGFNVLLEEISASGITLIIVTSLNEIPAIIKHVAVLANGRLVQTLPAKNVKEQGFALVDSLPQINETEIECLLNTTARPAFEWIIKMNGVNVNYGDVAVLKNIKWQVKQGQHWALLGPNGAGKSTLLSLVYGDNPQAYANDIILFDKKRGTGESIWDIKKNCGFVSPELFQYFPTDNNCLQVVESGFYDTLGLFRLSNPQCVAIAQRWMKVLNIGFYADKLFKNIPASAQRLCLLARALVKNPALLILDEPCQGMDDEQQQLFKHVIDTICYKSGLTLVYVTHYLHQIPNVVDHYMRLQQGEVASVETLSS